MRKKYFEIKIYAKREDRKIILSIGQNFHMKNAADLVNLKFPCSENKCIYFDIKIGESKKMERLSSE